MSKIRLAAGLCAVAIAFTAPAFAQAPPVRVVGLTCDAAPRVGCATSFRGEALVLYQEYPVLPG